MKKERLVTRLVLFSCLLDILSRHLWMYTTEWVYHIGQALSGMTFIPLICIRAIVLQKRSKNILDALLILSGAKLLTEIIYAISKCNMFNPTTYNKAEYVLLCGVITYFIIKNREIKNG